MADVQPQLLAEPSAEAQEPLVRENVPDPLAGEQTWPTEQVSLTMALDLCVSLPSGRCTWLCIWLESGRQGRRAAFSCKEMD